MCCSLFLTASSAFTEARLLLEYAFDPALMTDAILGENDLPNHAITEFTVLPAPIMPDGPGKRGDEVVKNKDMAQTAFSAWPNPTTGEVMFSTLGLQGSVVTIRDIRGAVMDRITVRKDETVVSYQAAKLPSGVYIVTLNEPSNSPQTLRIIKQ